MESKKGVGHQYFISNTAPKGTISLRGQEQRKDKKIWKSKSEERVVGLSSASLFPTRKRDADTQGVAMGIGYIYVYKLFLFEFLLFFVIIYFLFYFIFTFYIFCLIFIIYYFILFFIHIYIIYIIIILLFGVPEFNGTGIQKPPYYLKIDITFCDFFNYISYLL